MVPDIALAASAREWPDRLHRFLLDHGGGRIVDRVMSADQAATAGFDVLLIDDVCSFLTPRLVVVLKQAGVEVIGVYMPEDGADAKRRLLECGISDVIETEASPEEFRDKITATLAHRTIAPPPENHEPSPALHIGVTGACEGVGMTEIAISLATAMSSDLRTVLVDMDPSWPSVAQRLDLPVHPNIRTALDHALHRTDRLDEAIHEIGGLKVVGGRADGGQGPDILRPELAMLMQALGDHCEVIVADLGPLSRSEPGLGREFDTLILVATGDPVGVARLIRIAASARAANPSQPLLAVVNKAAPGGFRRSEILAEIGNALPDLPVLNIPADPRLAHAAWDGTMVSRGRYARSVEAMSQVVVRSVQ